MRVSFLILVYLEIVNYRSGFLTYFNVLLSPATKWWLYSIALSCLLMQLVCWDLSVANAYLSAMARLV